MGRTKDWTEKVKKGPGKKAKKQQDPKIAKLIGQRGSGMHYYADSRFNRH